MSTRKLFLWQTIHPSKIFYSAIWGIIIGIVISLTFNLVIFDNIFWLISALLIFWFVLHHASYLMLIIALTIGIIIGNYRVHDDIISASAFTDLTGETITISGKITEDPISSSGQVKLRLSDLRISDNATKKFSGLIYVQLSNPPTNLERSDEITIQGQVGAGFGVFLANFYRPKLISVTRSETGDIFARFKNWFAAQVRNFITSPAVDLGLGYLVGMKAGLSEKFSDALSAVGMTHVVVASGAHLGILVNAAKKLFGKFSKFSGILFSLILVLGFVLIVGFTPSMTRAALVTSLSLLVGYVGRKFAPLQLLSLVAALTLLLVPVNFQNLGWQLSFASFFGIMILAPRLQKILYGGKKLPWLAGMLITSISTSLICAPILIYNFGSLSFLSLIANLIILPTLPYAMLLVCLTGVFSFSAIAANLFGQFATYLLEFHIAIINFLSEKKMFILELPSGHPQIYLAYLPIIVFLLYNVIHENHFRDRHARTWSKNRLETQTSSHY